MNSKLFPLIPIELHIFMGNTFFFFFLQKKALMFLSKGWHDSSVARMKIMLNGLFLQPMPQLE